MKQPKYRVQRRDAAGGSKTYGRVRVSWGKWTTIVTTDDSETAKLSVSEMKKRGGFSEFRIMFGKEVIYTH